MLVSYLTNKVLIYMKKVNLFLDDEQYKKLIKKKGKLTWVQFVMRLTDGDDK